MSHALSTVHGRSSPPQAPASTTTALMATVRRPAGLGGDFVQVSVRWSYTEADPRILTLSYPGRGGTVRTLVRESVINAVLPGAEPQDQRGDVSVTALTVAGHGDVVVITLGDPIAQAPLTQLVFATDELVDFLADTEALVPLGAETDSSRAAAVLRSATADADPGPRAVPA